MSDGGRRVILPRFITDRFQRDFDKRESQDERFRQRIRVAPEKPQEARRGVSTPKATRTTNQRLLARRRAKRARYARRGKSVHNFRIHR